MKVSELITELQKHDPDAEVNTEGCDCTGDVGKVERDDHAEFKDGPVKKIVMLYRER